jgi:hypothetical protein
MYFVRFNCRTATLWWWNGNKDPSRKECDYNRETRRVLQSGVNLIYGQDGAIYGYEQAMSFNYDQLSVDSVLLQLRF